MHVDDVDLELALALLLFHLNDNCSVQALGMENYGALFCVLTNDFFSDLALRYRKESNFRQLVGAFGECCEAHDVLGRRPEEALNALDCM